MPAAICRRTGLLLLLLLLLLLQLERPRSSCSTLHQVHSAEQPLLP